ncbi:aegerolysin family protein [Paenibacillus kobensis]|uniref:aegerolysin family protein n=1 Tax=Paenibacillus kobensis TaxID=59841 RepID=UPI000FD773C5|nr:aegerolysin family protein [Paenibacillus kobensis]
MAYSMFVELSIENYNADVTIRNVKVEWGKLYKFGNKDHEIPVNEMEGTVVKAGTNMWFCACGRDWSPSGPQGSFELFDSDNNWIATYTWDCPLGEHYNKSELKKNNDSHFRFDFYSGNHNYYGEVRHYGTAIGRAHIRIWDSSKPPYSRRKY